MDIRDLRLGLAACVLIVIPVAAKAADANEPTVAAFTAPSLSNDELAVVTGMKLVSNFADTTILMANNDAVITAQQINSISRLMLENWSNDVAAPLILSNRLVAFGN